MKILVVNTGSSSLKIEWIDLGRDGRQTKLARFSAEKLGREANISCWTVGGTKEKRTEEARSVAEAFDIACGWLKALDGFSVEAIGHRVVHGGDKLTAPILISDAILREIESLNSLAPLHNPIALEAIRAAQKEFAQMPNVAVFDTAFHRTIPEVAGTYALPHELNERLRIRRYGFHGIAHEAMLNRYCELTNRAVASAKLITIQLGNGCSITAIRGGKSVDTSMGFTPGEGLVMGTRAGDIDSGLLTWLARKENLTLDQVEDLLNHKSGLLGLYGGSADMRDLTEAIQRDDARAQLALEVYCYRVRKYIGAYLAVLNGVEAIIFGGGVGEHSPCVRAKILQEMGWSDIRLDAEANAGAIGTESRISEEKSGVAIWVLPVDEAAVIAKAVAATVCR